MADSILDAYWQMPAIARTTATIAPVLTCAMQLGLISSHWLIFSPYFLWKFPPQLWRIVTCYLITAPGLGIIIDSYFLYTYMSQLEIGNPRFPRKADLVWYLMFVCSTILIINSFLDLPYGSFLHGLLLSLVYTATQDQRGMKTNFYIFTIPAQLTCVAMILINLLQPGGYMSIPLQLEGLAAAHLYDFLSRLWPQFGGGPNLLATPEWFVGLLRTPRVMERGFGTAFTPSTGASSSTDASRGPLPDSWKSRGPGQRLG